MIRELHQTSAGTPNSRVMADAIIDAIMSTAAATPSDGAVDGANGVEIKAGIDTDGFGWLAITSDTIRSLGEKWFPDKLVDSDFQESVCKILDKEQSAPIKDVEFDQTTWVVKLTIAYLES